MSERMNWYENRPPITVQELREAVEQELHTNGVIISRPSFITQGERMSYYDGNKNGGASPSLLLRSDMRGECMSIYRIQAGQEPVNNLTELNTIWAMDLCGEGSFTLSQDIQGMPRRLTPRALQVGAQALISTTE